MTKAWAKRYMTEWMQLNGIVALKVEEIEGAGKGGIWFAARPYLSKVKFEYLIMTEVDSEDQYDVYRRPLGSKDFADWEWVDAIQAIYKEGEPVLAYVRQEWQPATYKKVLTVKGNEGSHLVILPNGTASIAQTVKPS